MQPGATFQQFRMIRGLGAGFHGEVWLAEHLHTGARFAFKFMHLEDTKNASKARRALEVAKGNYRIEHDNVIRVHDLGCEPNGMVWLRMDYLEGKSVAELLHHGALSVLLALDIAIEVAWGLDAAHEIGIIHRDIKPDNLFMTRDGAIVVLDFSIAKVISAGIRTTNRKTAMGTAPYMAPEYLRGAAADPRFDVYALGITLWEMIAGHHPFHEVLLDMGELIRRQLHVGVAPLSAVISVPPGVDQLIARATARDPAARFATIAEMAQAMTGLKTWLLGEVAANRLVLARKRGEPAGVSSRRGRKDHRREAPLERAETPPLPSQRVVLPSVSTARPLAQTAPMVAVVDPRGTAPSGVRLDAAPHLESAERRARFRSTAPLPSAPAPDTVRGRSRPSAAPSKRSPAMSWRVLGLFALVVALGLGIAVVRAVAARPSLPEPAPTPTPNPPFDLKN